MSLQPKGGQLQEGAQSMMFHTAACMNIDDAKQGIRLQSFLHDFRTNKHSSVLKIGLKIAMIRKTVCGLKIQSTID